MLILVSGENDYMKTTMTAEEKSYTANIGMTIVVSHKLNWKYAAIVCMKTGEKHNHHHIQYHFTSTVAS